MRIGVAIAALVLAVLPNIPGFLATVKAIPQSSVVPIFLSIYRYAWFVGFALAFTFYLLLRGITGSRGPANDVILSGGEGSR
jgi:NCS1 family nucleobase:cation symporter-1